MNYERRNREGNFDVREKEDEMTITGYFALFNERTCLFEGAYEEIDPEAFNRTLESADVRALINHDTSRVLGRTSSGTLKLSTDERGLKGTILINPHDQEAVNLYERVKRGDVNQCSFGFDIRAEEFFDHEETVLWRLKDVELYEVSVCTFPAYEGTSVQARKKALEERSERAAEVWRVKMKRRVENA